MSSGREERPQSSEETQTSPAPTVSTAPPVMTVGISEGTVARARERIQQQAHSSSPSQSGMTRSRTSQPTSGQMAQPQSLLPGMSQYTSSTTERVDPTLQALRQSQRAAARSLDRISQAHGEIRPEESATSSVSFVPKHQRSPEGTPIP